MPEYRYHLSSLAGEMLLGLRRGRNRDSWWLNLAAPFEYLLATLFLNVFPLPRRGNFRASFAHAGEAMDRGFNVVVFPEGRRSPGDALPVYLGGLTELKTGNSRWFRAGRIAGHAGKPLCTRLEKIWPYHFCYQRIITIHGFGASSQTALFIVV